MYCATSGIFIREAFRSKDTL